MVPKACENIIKQKLINKLQKEYLKNEVDDDSDVSYENEGDIIEYIEKDYPTWYKKVVNQIQNWSDTNDFKIIDEIWISRTSIELFDYSMSYWILFVGKNRCLDLENHESISDLLKWENNLEDIEREIDTLL